MATSGERTSQFSNTGNGSRPAFYMRLAYALLEADEANNRSRWRVSLRVTNPSRWTASWTAARPAYQINVNGNGVAGGTVPAGTFDFRDGAEYHVVDQWDSGWISHSSTGYCEIDLEGDIGAVDVFGDAPGIDLGIRENFDRLPDAPDSRSVGEVTSTSIEFRWGIADPNGSSVVEYQIQIDNNSDFSSPISSPRVGTAHSYVFTGRARNTLYYMRARARTVVGWGPWTSAVSARTLDGLPAAPANPTAGTRTSSSIVVNWTEATADAGDPITGYEVQRSTNSSFTAGLSSETVSASTRTSTFDGLSRVTSYYFRVRAISAAGQGPWSGTLTAQTLPELPSAPTLSSLTVVNASTLRAAYTAPTDNGGVDLTGYDLQRATNSSFTTGVATVSDSASPYDFTGLTSGTLYYVRVRAKNSEGAGPWSNVRSATPWTNPSAPTLTSVTPSADGTSATVTWTAPTDNGGVAITGYEITRYNSAGTAIQTYQDTASPLVITGLTPGTTYRYAVRAKNAAGTGPYSAQVTVAQPGAPSAPNLTTLTVVDGDTARVAFTAPSSNGGQPITGYDIQSATNSSFSANVVTRAVGAAGTHTVNDMVPGVTYYWRVRAKNAVGAGAWSNVRSALQDQVPGVPLDLTVTPSAAGTSATLTWSPPTPNGGSAVTMYIVTRYSSTGVQQTSYETAQRTLTVNGLVAGATHRWTVRAENLAGYGPMTAQVTRTQPSPSVKAGDYFDGATAARGDVTYAWEGTAHASASIATQAAPTGWMDFSQSANSSGATGAIALSSDTSMFGDHAVMVKFFKSVTIADRFFVAAGDTTARMAAVPEEADMVGSMYVRLARQARLVIAMRFYNASGTLIRMDYGAPVVVPADEWTRVQGSFTSPTGAAYAAVTVRDVPGEGANLAQAGDVNYYDGAMITLGTSPFPYFDGYTADTEEYTYYWEGTPNASASRRDTVELAEGQDDPLRDPDCPPFPTPPRPPSISDVCATQVDQWRRYWIQVPASQVTLSQVTIPILTLKTTTHSANQVRIRFYEDPYNQGAGGVDADEFISEQILSYIPKNTELTLDSMTKRAYAKVGKREAIPADHLVFGSRRTPPVWPTMDCGIGYMIALDVPSFLPVGAVTMKIQLARRVR